MPTPFRDQPLPSTSPRPSMPCAPRLHDWPNLPQVAVPRQHHGEGAHRSTASRGGNAHRRFGLNLIGLTPSGESLDTLWDRHEDLPWHRSVRWAQAALQTLESRSSPGAGERERLDQRVGGILNGLARRLVRDRRARGRRTRHAEERHVSGKRPTGKAVEDVRAAADDAFMLDERSDTLVVLGQRGRTHFFSPEGQLVSSVRYSKEAIARKIKVKRWRSATTAESTALRDRLG